MSNKSLNVIAGKQQNFFNFLYLKICVLFFSVTNKWKKSLKTVKKSAATFYNRGIQARKSNKIQARHILGGSKRRRTRVVKRKIIIKRNKKGETTTKKRSIKTRKATHVKKLGKKAGKKNVKKIARNKSGRRTKKKRAKYFVKKSLKNCGINTGKRAGSRRRQNSTIKIRSSAKPHISG
jgi:hypothetical protein